MARTKPLAVRKWKEQFLHQGVTRTGSPGWQQQRLKNPRHWSPGTVALRRIGKYLNSTEMLIPNLPFACQCKVYSDFHSNGNVTRWTPEALLMMQDAAELHLLELFVESNICAIEAKRVIVMQRDVQLAARRIGAIPKFTM